MSQHEPSSFKQTQLGYERVSKADDRCGTEVARLLQEKCLGTTPFQVYFRVFKEEGELECWVAKAGGTFSHLKTYTICCSSGKKGPKRKQGDLQVPEGFYTLSRFNPLSLYHLSIGLDYPNTSDRILGDKNNLGGDVFIHGKCVSVGCLAMTDELMEEIYLISVEARDRSETPIFLHSFPCKLTDSKFKKLMALDPKQEVAELWGELKVIQDIFESTKKLPEVAYLHDGRHRVQGI